MPSIQIQDCSWEARPMWLRARLENKADLGNCKQAWAPAPGAELLQHPRLTLQIPDKADIMGVKRKEAEQAGEKATETLKPLASLEAVPLSSVW